jgi:hypothetical protein
VGDSKYEFEGGLDTLRQGFEAIGMPRERWEDALAIVAEVLDANAAVDFSWYKPDRTGELACTWAGVGQNAMWVGPNNVHVAPATTHVVLPKRALNYSKENGVVGWLLPGATTGSGGGRRAPATRWVRCPTTQEPQPAGSTCPDCMIVHES